MRKLSWRREVGPRFLGLAIIGVLAGALSSAAQVGTLKSTVSLGTLTPTYDEWGRVLRGHPDRPASEGCLVMVLWTPDGQIDPPDRNGYPSSRNQRVIEEWLPDGCTAIGHTLVSPKAPPGVFSTVVRDFDRYVGGYFFVRIFNAPTLEEASFYGDGLPLAVPSRGGRLIYTVPRTDRPLDPGDDDGDGLNNSWEKSVGSDPQDPNTDDDEMTDWEEWLAGSDPTRADSMFRVRVIRRGAGGSVVLGWPTVAGRRYRVWYVEGVEGLSLEQLAERGVEITSEPLEAAGDYLEHEMSWAPATERGYFYVTAEE